MAGGFYDTSGLDAQNIYGGTTNNAAADFDRLNAQSPQWFGGKKDKKQAQHDALQKSVDTPITPTPNNPTAAPNPSAAPALSSAPGLVKSVLTQIANPPQYNKDGAALVPGTPFTPQEFASQLVQNTVQHMNALAPPPPEAMQADPSNVRSPAAAPYQGIPQFGPTMEGPPRREQQSPFGNRQFGGNTFGGNRFGGNTFGGNQFQDMQRLPQLVDEQTQMQNLPMSPMDPAQRILAIARAGRQVPQQTAIGHFRGGSIKMMRGGYPDLMPLDPPEGVPVREPYASGNYVESDGQGDGRSDHVDAKLSPGEFVMDAETTSLLGNGNSDAGARGMEAIRQHIRKEKGKQLAQGKFSPNARKPGYYAGVAMKAAKGTK